MKDNRDKWQFYTHPSKAVLSASDVRYWKELLKKLLKVGLELEFNLPQQKDTCKGEDSRCPCIYIDEGCWEECKHVSRCKVTPCYDTCSNRTNECKPEDCATCKNYKFMCLGTSCVDFLSSCFKCTRFKKNCDTCPYKYDPSKDPAQTRKYLKEKFKPSGSYTSVGEHGVVGITTDGSLMGDKGVEIITVGRRVDFFEFYQMAKKIIDEVSNKGGYLNERCGAHAHVLTSYYSDNQVNEMERDMPEIILANFHQLCRRYQNAMVWMTSALGNPNHITRWEKFRVSVLEISPITKQMIDVVDEVAGHAGGNKYGLVNYNRTRFNSKTGKDVRIFHIEMRVADATLCPSVWASIACLFYALAIKAVEISRYGTLKVGGDGWMKRAKAMKKSILNNCGDYNGNNRLSDTKDVFNYQSNFIEESHDMLSQLKGILIKFGPAYDILTKLADKPASIRRMEGESWEKIESDLKTDIDVSDKIEFKISEVVNLRLIEDCKSIKEWITEASKITKEINENEAEEIDISEEDVKNYINTKMEDGEMIWSNSTGSVISI